MNLPTIILICSTYSSILVKSMAVDTIKTYQTFRDGDTIISAGGEFEFGFFSPGSSTNRYLGIWYKKISKGTVVWVANRDRPLMDTSGVIVMACVVPVDDVTYTTYLDVRGFVPRFPVKWNAADWSDGCIRRSNLVCGIKEGFVKYSGVKLPDTRHSWYDMTVDLPECQKLCLENCSGTAYANADVRRGGHGHGCLLWFGDLSLILETTQKMEK